MVNIKNLNFKYKDKLIFENFNLNIKENTITTIIGPNGCGKSTLVKILSGLLEFEGNIEINNIKLNKDNKKDIRKTIGVVFENPDNQFVKEIVYDEISFVLKNIGMDKNEINDEVLKIAKYLKIDNILNWEIRKLNTNQKQLVCLASSLVHKPKLLILDESLSLIDPLVRDNILELLNDLKEEGMTIINISHDIEDTLISDEIVVMDNGKIVIKGKKEKVFKDEKLLNSLGYDLPFMVELSNRLMFYGLIDHIIYDMKEMVDTLWK